MNFGLHTFASSKQTKRFTSKLFKNMATSKFTNEQHKQAFDLLVDFKTAMQSLGLQSSVTINSYANGCVLVSASYCWPKAKPAEVNVGTEYFSNFDSFYTWLESLIESASEKLEEEWHAERCQETAKENDGLTFEYENGYKYFYDTDAPEDAQLEWEQIGDNVVEELNRTQNEFSEKFHKAFELLENKIKAI